MLMCMGNLASESEHFNALMNVLSWGWIKLLPLTTFPQSGLIEQAMYCSELISKTTALCGYPLVKVPVENICSFAPILSRFDYFRNCPLLSFTFDMYLAIYVEEQF